jgi:hypothetical protein
MKRLSRPDHRLALSLLILGLLATPALAQPGALAATPERNGSAFAHPIVGPTVIDRPGSYVLLRSFSLNHPGTAIAIVASNVSLDLNGHTITGPGNKQGTGIRITQSGGVRVHGGTLSRFGTGVDVTNSHNVSLRGLQINGQDLGGPPPGEVGVLIVNSRNVVAEHNVVSRTFLGFFIRGGGSGANRIAANTVAGGQNGQLGICYNPDGSNNPDGPTGDFVYNNLVSRFQIGIQTSAGTSGNIITENAIAFVQQDVQEVTPGSNLIEDNKSIQIGL